MRSAKLVMQLYKPPDRSCSIFSYKSVFQELQQRFGIDMTKAFDHNDIVPVAIFVNLYYN
jgi:hypothetical protein